MKTQNLLFLIVTAIVMTACGSTESAPFSGLFNGEVSPGTATGSGSGASSGTTNGTFTGTGACNSTTTGGCFKILSGVATPLSSSQELRGFAANDSNIYSLIRENDGGGIIHWKINSTSVSAPTTWTQVCSILDDGNFNGGLASNGTSFYTFGSSNSLTELRTIRVFNASCIEQTPLQVPETVVINNTVAFPQVQNLIAPTVNSIFYETCSGLQNYQPSTTSLQSLFTSSTLGGKTFSWAALTSSCYTYAGADPETVSTFAAWGLDTNSFSVNCSATDQPPLLWKFQTNGTPTGWGQLPVSTYPFLCNQYLNFIAQPDANTVIVVSTQTSQFQMYFVDVSEF
jgi:hypothetical protein